MRIRPGHTHVRQVSVLQMVFTLAPASALADFTGRVVKVSDGGTLRFCQPKSACAGAGEMKRVE
jgi:hypothetical protein